MPELSEGEQCCGSDRRSVGQIQRYENWRSAETHIVLAVRIHPNGQGECHRAYRPLFQRTPGRLKEVGERMTRHDTERQRRYLALRDAVHMEGRKH